LIEPINQNSRPFLRLRRKEEAMARTFLGGTRLAEMERMMMTPPRFGYDAHTERRKTPANLTKNNQTTKEGGGKSLCKRKADSLRRSPALP
jgi:hypothetical protein